MSKGRICTLYLVILVSLLVSPRARAEVVVPEFQSIVALGFFPLGGNLVVPEAQLSTYVGGVNFALFPTWGRNYRFTLFGAGAYLIGFNWLALAEPTAEEKAQGLADDSKATFFNWGLARVGPQVRFKNVFGTSALGAELGYAWLLRGDTTRVETKYQHGLELSFTVAWNEYEGPEGRSGANLGMITGGLLLGGLSVLGIYYGHDLYAGADAGSGTEDAGMLVLTAGAISGAAGLVMFLLGINE